ncbi:MAG: type I DNA topoisomerase [Candidatus Walczuchella monophlebidarum]
MVNYNVSTEKSMGKNLIIVESPTKVKTIQNYLDKYKSFEVVSSFGHIVNLPEKSLGIDRHNDFEPLYVVPKDKKNLVKKLQSLINNHDIIWLASDEDREGEAIAWHIYNKFKIPENKIRRIVFHEITKKSILQAIEKPRPINNNLVYAQKARRVLDRLVGFELSPVLWKKIKKGLSAGRVQSVAVRLIVEREKEITNFKTTSFYRVKSLFLSENKKYFKAQLEKTFINKELAEKFLKKCISANFSINKIVKKPVKKSPLSPFTTSSLQQEAFRKLGYSVEYTMRMVQQLYEEGYTTYIRTDSLNISDDAISSIKYFIIKNFGEKYLHIRRYTTKSKSAQEAHEAIRPTDVSKFHVSSDINKQRLYELIWQRTISGQMSDALLEKTTIYINTPEKYNFLAKGEIIVFDGFLILYKNTKETDENYMTKLKEGEVLKNKSITAIQRFTKNFSRYSEASLVDTLETLGIGRPSTYVPTILTIKKRHYIKIEDIKGIEHNYEVMTLIGSQINSYNKTELSGGSKKKIIPTDIGIIVNDFLIENFNQIINYDFTAKIENHFDQISQGNEGWNNLIKSFYIGFHSKIEYIIKNIGKNYTERLLGNDSKSGKKVFAKIGRFGPMIQMGEIKDKEKPKFSPLLKHQHIHRISLEEALKLFEFPHVLGTFEEKEIIIKRGRFGPYIQYDGKSISIQEYSGYCADDMTLEQVIELIKKQRKENAKNIIQRFEEIKPPIEIVNGRFSPYIRQGQNHYKLPKNIHVEQLNLEQCKKIIDALVYTARKRRT